MALRHRTVSIGRIEDRLKEIVELFNVSDDKLFSLKQLITSDCKTQLDQPPTDRKRMHETYVVNLPDGTEHGEYIVLDFGGKFFRVVYVKLNIVLNKTGERRYSIAPENSSDKGFDVDPTEQVYMESMIYPLEKQIVKVSYKELFEYFAQSCLDFCTRFKLLSKDLPVILVNSYPCLHSSLQSARLIRWGKEAGKDPDAIGVDFGAELQAALKSKNLPHRVASIINDSVACLFSGLSEEHNTRIGLIVGTGFNLSFLRQSEPDVFESESDVFQSESVSTSTTVINSELGSFGEGDELKPYLTKYDLSLINSDLYEHPGQQVFEKMVTGSYVPELFRIICKDLVDQGVLFNGQSSDLLDTPGGIPQNFLGQIIRAGEQGLNHVQDVLINAEICAMYADAEAVLKISKALILRSAAFVSAAVAGVISHSCPNRHIIFVSVDGSLYKSYPILSKNVSNMTSELLGPAYDVTFRTSYDGSAKGAAFITAKNVE